MTKPLVINIDSFIDAAVSKGAELYIEELFDRYEPTIAGDNLRIDDEDLNLDLYTEMPLLEEINRQLYQKFELLLMPAGSLRNPILELVRLNQENCRMIDGIGFRNYIWWRYMYRECNIPKWLSEIEQHGSYLVDGIEMVRIKQIPVHVFQICMTVNKLVPHFSILSLTLTKSKDE